MQLRIEHCYAQNLSTKETQQTCRRMRSSNQHIYTHMPETSQHKGMHNKSITHTSHTCTHAHTHTHTTHTHTHTHTASPYREAQPLSNSQHPVEDKDKHRTDEVVTRDTGAGNQLGWPGAIGAHKGSHPKEPVYACTCGCARACICVCVCACVYMYVCKFVCAHECVCMNMCVCVCAGTCLEACDFCLVYFCCSLQTLPNTSAP